MFVFLTVRLIEQPYFSTDIIVTLKLKGVFLRNEKSVISSSLVQSKAQNEN